jgi:hypothetical protein
MIEKATALEIRNLALAAVQSLMEALHSSEGKCSAEDSMQIQRGVGLSIGRIETDLLAIIYRQYPELDDLKDTPSVHGLSNSEH